MKNKVAEMFGVMIRNKKAADFFRHGWFSLYSDMMNDPIKAMKDGENDKLINKICAMALADWYASTETIQKGAIAYVYKMF